MRIDAGEEVDLRREIDRARRSEQTAICLLAQVHYTAKHIAEMSHSAARIREMDELSRPVAVRVEDLERFKAAVFEAARGADGEVPDWGKK